MADYSKLLPAVRDEFKRGATPEEAFRSICKQSGQNPPSYKFIGEFMDRFYENIGSTHGTFYNDLRSAIIGQYSKFTHAISSRKSLKYHVDGIVLNNRFNLGVDSNLDSLAIIDLFNKETRKLQIAPDDLPITDDCTVAQIDHDLVLLSDLYQEGYFQFLLQIDFNTQSCSILDTVNSEYIVSTIITDSTNCSEFANLKYNEEDDGFSYGSMQKGRVINNRIIIEDRQINFNGNLYLCKLEGGNIFGFRNIDDLNWQFCEFPPDVGSGQIVKSYDAEFPDDFDPREALRYVWSKSKLYVPKCHGSSFMIVVFDAETYTWTQTKAVGMSRYPDLYIDENEVLTVDATEHSKHERFKTSYRFPMKKPDKLKYLAWSTVRRGSIFFESDLYERLLPRLPLNSEFRPFSENYVYNIECDMKMEI